MVEVKCSECPLTFLSTIVLYNDISSRVVTINIEEVIDSYPQQSNGCTYYIGQKVLLSRYTCFLFICPPQLLLLKSTQLRDFNTKHKSCNISTDFKYGSNLVQCVTTD